MLTASLARSFIVRHASCARKSCITASKPQRRAFSSSVIQTLSDGFLDLAIALPLPPSLPPYSTTIILLTVATRLVFTLPFSIWAKNRQWKAENLVIPQIKQEMPRFHKQAIQDMKRDNFRGDKDAASVEVNKRVKALAKVRQKELLALHHASPLPTMAIPPATQLPVFVVSTMVLANTSQPPSVLDSESFLTITSLTHSDPTATLPIALGLVTLVNVETSRWFVSAAATAREKQVAQWVAERRAKGEAVVEPRKVMQTSLRILSVARILVAVAVPGNIQIYWVASATFGLIQTWALDWWHARRTEKYWQTHIPPLKSRVP